MAIDRRHLAVERLHIGRTEGDLPDTEGFQRFHQRARRRHGGHPGLALNGAGELVNFVSDDRSRSEPEGAFAARRFSTPVRDYRDFGPVRLTSFGEARWLLPDGEFTYGEFRLIEIAYNGSDDHDRARLLTAASGTR